MTRQQLGAFTVKGTAKDNVAVSNVLVSLNNGAWNPADRQRIRFLQLDQRRSP